MHDKSIREQLQSYGVRRVVGMINDDPDKNLPKVMDWVDRLLDEDMLSGQRTVIRNVINDHENIWYRVMKSFWTDIDDNVRKTLLENFFVDACVVGIPRQEKAKKEHNCNIPWAILMDPTSACNLGCTGCWAAEYGDQLSMDYDTLDSIIRQGKALGTYFYIYSGGEPLVRKKDIIRLCEEHDDCMFLALTNGTLIY